MKRGGWLLGLALLVSAACGRPDAARDASRLQEMGYWFGFCMNPQDVRYDTVDGRFVMRMACGPVWQPSQSLEERSFVRDYLGQMCPMMHRPFTKAGGPFNYKPTTPKGDVAGSFQEAALWRRWACYN